MHHGEIWIVTHRYINFVHVARHAGAETHGSVDQSKPSQPLHGVEFLCMVSTYSTRMALRLTNLTEDKVNKEIGRDRFIFWEVTPAEQTLFSKHFSCLMQAFGSATCSLKI